MSMVERQAAAIRRSLAIPGGEAAVEQITTTCRRCT